MKKFLLILVLLIAGNCIVLADEGMWLPLLIDRLNYVDMQKMGLKLTPEEIYSVNKSSLKDAIVLFGQGCTGEIVSAQGLLLTNHHCGYGSIQSKSTIENDYLTTGFWAMKTSEELPIPGLTVKFLIRIVDVSQKVLAGLTGNMTEEDRTKKIKEISETLQKEAITGTNFEASVKSFYEGNEFYMFVYQTYKDVRLVGAPPSSIGKFGADTDNWMWPRHTGDFSMFRVYTAPDGSPATYSKKNIPMKPKYSLPVSIKGVNNNDFTMILGYPGTTERYLTSYGINFYVKESYPTRIDIRGKKLEIMRTDMDINPDIRIKYASKYAGISNYWKNFIGTVKALRKLTVADKKKQLENEFEVWIQSDNSRKEKYGTVLPLIREAYSEMHITNNARIYYAEAITGCEAMTFTKRFMELQKLLMEKTPDTVKVNVNIAEIRKASDRFFKDYNLSTDMKITEAMLSMYFKNVTQEQQTQYFIKLVSKFKSDFNKLTTSIFSKSLFKSRETVEAFLRKPSLKALESDRLFALMSAFTDSYNSLNKSWNDANHKLSGAKRLLIAGLREMKPDTKFYPDANQTMRLTYGKVMDYYPADGLHYDYYTTLEGVMQKEDSSSWEFVVSPKLKALYRTKDYGVYGENGVMKTCFISNNDITGGNSGSPVLDGSGNLIGLAFDGNWEAMSGNICFEPELQRTINVDIRYVLFIIDKYAGAKNLISEMNILN
jgi:hypothetical protein